MRLKLERYPEGVIGTEGVICDSCFGMGESGTRAIPTRYAYGDLIPGDPIEFCDTCLVGLRDLLTKHIDEHRITKRVR